MAGWQALREGSVIDIISPAFGTTAEVKRAFARALEAWGWKARFARESARKDLLSAAPDDARFKQLEAALNAPDSDAVWALRGGYGCARLLPALAGMKKPRRVKPLIGFSDLTALHLFLNQRWGWPSLHAPVGLGVAGKNLKAASRKDLELILSGRRREQVFSRLKPLNALAKREGAIAGPVLGGNMKVASSLLGTPYVTTPGNAILFFEDIDERGYRVDRMLTQLSQAGWFDSAKAVLFGQFTGGEEAQGRSLVPKVIQRFAETQACPVFSGMPVGHDDENRTLPLGAQAWINPGKNPALRVQTGCEDED